jgi:fimbrial chaperone protein
MRVDHRRAVSVGGQLFGYRHDNGELQLTFTAGERAMNLSWRGLTAAVLLAASLDAMAATFGLTPMRVELSERSPTAIVTVNNSGDSPLSVQVQAYTWTQPGGADVYDETRGFIISPPIFTIPPGGSQVVRVAIRGAPPVDVEQAFRLIFREVPPAEESAADQALFYIALNMNIPMYVAPTAVAAAPKATFAFDPGAGGSPRLRIANDGNGNLRLSNLVVAQEQVKLAEEEVYVVLPGAMRFIFLPKDRLRAGTPLRVEAQSNAGRIDAAVPVVKP